MLAMEYFLGNLTHKGLKNVQLISTKVIKKRGFCDESTEKELAPDADPWWEHDSAVSDVIKQRCCKREDNLELIKCFYTSRIC